jgi:transposase InsO family protein
MGQHPNATLGPAGRIELARLQVEDGLSERAAAAVLSTSHQTAHRWKLRRLNATTQELASGAWAKDRSSRPHRSPTKSSAALEHRVCEERHRTGWGPRLIAGELGIAHSTIHAVLRRHALSRPEKAERDPVRRYEWPCPGDLLQIDTKRLARFSRPGHKITGNRSTTSAEKREKVGWEFCHSAIDDHTRIAYTEVHRDEKAATVVGFIDRALAFYAGLGIAVRRLQTDNAWTYIHNNTLAALLAKRDIAHHRIPPRMPKRNGKVERYQQTLAREWAYGQRYRSSDARAAALTHWLEHYNHGRPHSSLGGQTPISRATNLPGQDT